jgi:hypothetical protein
MLGCVLGCPVWCPVIGKPRHCRYVLIIRRFPGYSLFSEYALSCPAICPGLVLVLARRVLVSGFSLSRSYPVNMRGPVFAGFGPGDLAVAAYSFSLLSDPTPTRGLVWRMGGLPIGRLRSEVNEGSVPSRV